MPLNIAGRGVQSTGQTTPVIITTTLVIEQPAAPTDFQTTAESPVQVVAPATVEAPPTTTPSVAQTMTTADVAMIVP